MMSANARADAKRYWPRLAALALTMLLPSLATSITNVALPTLADAFETTMADVQWVVIAYLIAVTSLIVGAGRLGDLAGRRRVLLSGMAVFAAASAMAAASPGLPVLIAARAIQGVGGAVMMTLTVAMVGDLVPRDRTGGAMGVLGTISAVGTALGPTVGGGLIDYWGWPSVFIALAAMGIVAVIGCGIILPADRPAARRMTGLDLPGLSLLAFSLATFSAASAAGSRISGFSLIAFLALSALALAAFARTEARSATPLLRLDLLRDRTLAIGLASLMLVSTIMMATLVVGPFFLSGTLGLDPVDTGLLMSVGPAVAALTGVPAGRLVDRLGPLPVIIAGLLAVMIGALMLTILPGLAGPGGYAASLVVLTLGYAMFQAANLTAIMAKTGEEHRGVTSALVGLSRNVGLIWGASAMAAIYAMGPTIAGALGVDAGQGGGLRITFAAGAFLAGVALGMVLLELRSLSRPEKEWGVEG